MKKFRAYYWESIKDEKMFKEIVDENRNRINDYITVMVFEGYEEMYKEVDKIESGCDNFTGKNNRDFDGRTLICRKQLYEEGKEGVWDYSHAQGFIFLCDENNKLTFSTISHEVGHAVIGYMGAYFKNKFKIKRYEDKEEEKDILYEELFCYITGSLNNQILMKVA